MEQIELSIPYVISYRPPMWRGNYCYNPLSREKAKIQELILEQHMGEPIEGPVWAEAEFSIAMPKSWSKSKREAERFKPCLKKLDVDNLLKFLGDALTSTTIVDDSQIWCWSANKVWDYENQTKVW